MTAFPESVEIIRAAALAADEKKAENIVAFDVSDSLAITDAFMVASAPNERQVSAVVDAIEDKLSVPAHARRVKASVKRRLDTDPKPVIAAAAAGTVGVVALVAGIVKSVRR